MARLCLILITLTSLVFEPELWAAGALNANGATYKVAQEKNCVSLQKRITGGLDNIIPTPQWMEARSSQIVLVDNGKAQTVLVLSEKAAPKERIAAEHLAAWVQKISGVRLPIVTTLAPSDRRAAIVIGSVEPRTIPDPMLARLDRKDRDFLVRGNRTKQDYVIDCMDIGGQPIVVLCGTSPQGAMYAMMSLLHALSLDARRVTLKRVHIRDYPDVEFRWMKALSPKGTPESMIDWAMEHKINVLRAPERETKEERLRLSGYAHDRGVRLLSILFGDFSMKNRRTYPGGPTYSCIGEDIVNEAGYCMSNPDLIAEKVRKLREFVDACEPGCVYIHFLDIDYYHLTEKAWLRRCSECRRRWPNDRLEAPDGKAGAQAALYDQLVKTVRGVKHEETDYDASRDCLIIFVSAPYTQWSEANTMWEKELAYHTTVSQLMEPASNVHFTIRENGPGAKHTKRIPELAKALDHIGHGHKVMTYYHCADRRTTLGDYPVVHQLWRNFTCAAVMTKAFEGSGSILLAGTGHPLINAGYAWNNESYGFYLDPETQAEFGEKFRLLLADHFRAPEIQGSRGFVDRALAHMYGPSNVTRMRPQYLPEHYAHRLPAILPPKGRTWFDYCQKERSDNDSPRMNRKWAKLFAAYETAGRRAVRNTEQCLGADDFNVAYREYIESLLADMRFGTQLAKLAASETNLLAEAAQSNRNEIETIVLRWKASLADFRKAKPKPTWPDGSRQNELKSLASEMDKDFREKLEILRRREPMIRFPAFLSRLIEGRTKVSIYKN